MAKKTPQSVCTAIEACIDEVTAQAAQAAHDDQYPFADWYSRSYRDIRAYFEDLTARKAWTVSTVRVGFLIVYGWMPTAIRRFDHDMAEALVPFLNDGALRLDQRVQLSALAGRVANNSMVGGSKFLHFYDPAMFPITDSVLQMLTGKPVQQTAGSDLSHYQRYCEALDLVSEAHRQRAQTWADQAFAYPVSTTRAIEALVFYAQKKKRTDSNGAEIADE